MVELKNTKLVKSFRNNSDDWHEFYKNANNVFYTYNNDKHDYENHLHLYIRREDGEIGYNIKKNNRSIESGILDEDWNANDFKEYYGRHSGGRKIKSSIRKKTKRKNKKYKLTKKRRRKNN